MNPKLEKVQNKFLESIDRMSEDFGLNGFVAKLYGYLYLHGKPLSLDEISVALGASKGNVSINIRELEKWGAVRKVWVKGSRKDYYEADSDIKKVLSNKLKSAIQKRISQISSILDETSFLIKSANGELTGEEKHIARSFAERLRTIGKLKKMASVALGAAEKFL
jgi:DNA-binding transcriptional regulator GbsR (MarR family)